MIKVIASDMDGTLLDVDHQLNHKTAETVRKACAAGIRFIIATGREYFGMMRALGGEELVCDYILNSGSEVRNSKQEILFSKVMNPEDCRAANQVLEAYEIGYVLCSYDYDYFIGTEEEMEEAVVEHIHTFDHTLPIETIKDTEIYHRIRNSTIAVPSFDALMEQEQRIRKIFVFSDDIDKLQMLKNELRQLPNLYISGSFYNNVEITDIDAQKGPVLKNYIESLGYTMDEVMVFGDSHNDLSMLAMDFGATVAMDNADPEVKAVCKYVTKSNGENGVAYAIEELLKRQYSETVRA